jgi:hypothetical protein
MTKTLGGWLFMLIVVGALAFNPSTTFAFGIIVICAIYGPV